MTTRMITACALACALMTGACSDDFGPTEPISAPSLSQNEAGWARWDVELTGGEEVDGSQDSWESESWELVESDLDWTASVASAVIGRRGGTVTLWAFAKDGGWQPNHSLTVPAGAVKRPTHFVMELGPDDVIDVHLSATEVSSGRQITEFGRPLSITLTYDGASVEDPDGLNVVHLVNGTISEVVSGTVDADLKIVTGELSHFSRYAVAFR